MRLITSRVNAWLRQAVLSGAAFLMFGFVGHTATLVTSTLGAAEAPSAVCQAPASVSTFQSTDPAVYLYYLMSGVQAGDQTRVDWVAPDGAIPASHSYTQSGGSSGRCYWEQMQIGFGPGEAKPGDWVVKVYWNRSRIGVGALSHHGGAASYHHGGGQRIQLCFGQRCAGERGRNCGDRVRNQ